MAGWHNTDDVASFLIAAMQQAALKETVAIERGILTKDEISHIRNWSEEGV